MHSCAKCVVKLCPTLGFCVAQPGGLVCPAASCDVPAQVVNQCLELEDLVT